MDDALSRNSTKASIFTEIIKHLGITSDLPGPVPLFHIPADLHERQRNKYYHAKCRRVYDIQCGADTENPEKREKRVGGNNGTHRDDVDGEKFKKNADPQRDIPVTRDETPQKSDGQRAINKSNGNTETEQGK